MHTVHAGMSIAAPVIPEKLSVINAVLQAMNQNPGNNSTLPFAKSPSTQLVSAVVIPFQQCDGKDYPATLMIMTSYTGPFDNHLDELISIGAQGLCDLLKNCIGFPTTTTTSAADLKKFIKAHCKPDTFYTGMQYITHNDINNENNLRLAIEAYLDAQQTTGALNGMQPDAVQKNIQAYINSQSQFSWAKEPWKRTSADFWALWGGAIFTGLAALLFLVLATIGISALCNTSCFIAFIYLLLALIAVIGFVLITYRMDELNQKFVAPRQPDEKVRAVMCTQNHPVINEMTIAGPLKKGWVHFVTFNLVLRVITLIRGSITIPTIATARWLTIDGGKRLVFISNFANLSESYVRDFIDARGSASRINLVFGQGNGYPATKWLMGAGALTNPDAFLNDVHLYQQKTQLWYWPYMNLSVDNINVNRKIRLGLYQKFATPKETADWLKLF